MDSKRRSEEKRAKTLKAEAKRDVTEAIAETDPNKTEPASQPDKARYKPMGKLFQGEYAREMSMRAAEARRRKSAERKAKVELAKLGFDEALKVKAGEEIEALTAQWVTAAKRGESWALQGIWNRMEGTPTQRVVTERAGGDAELRELSDAELDELARKHGVAPLRLVREPEGPAEGPADAAAGA